MPRRDIKKSFRLDSEPCLLWPKSPAKMIYFKEVRLERWGKGMAYTLHPEKTASVQLVGWDPRKGFAAWRDVFSGSQSDPAGLVALASLNDHFNLKNVLEWVSHHGLLGFRPTPISVTKDGPYSIPVTGGNNVVFHHYEPIDCIYEAAQRAADVIALWSALKNSYKTDEQAIRSIVTLQKDNPLTVGSDYATFVNREYRGRWAVPESKRDWRRLATQLLSEYIQEHMFREIEVGVGIQGQNKDAEEERNKEPSPDWNLKPIWRIQSALAAYYVELLMILRRFRSCKTCDADISHQRAGSIYCWPSSNCRSKLWHRQDVARKRSLIGS